MSGIKTSPRLGGFIIYGRNKQTCYFSRWLNVAFYWRYHNWTAETEILPSPLAGEREEVRGVYISW